MIKKILFVFIFSISILFVKAQHDEFYYSLDIDVDDEIATEISEYDKYNPIIGAEVYRMCNNRRCNGHVIDEYNSEKILHRGFYTRGLLLNGYENYHENGEIERIFKVTGPNGGILTVFYPSGNKKNEVEYFKNRIISWKDYYSNGNLEFHEEFHKDYNYHTKYDYYYINGNPESTLQLIDDEKMIYEAKDYYPNGNIKEQGNKIWVPSYGGFSKDGKWEIYDINGNLTSTEKHTFSIIVEDGEEYEFEDEDYSIYKRKRKAKIDLDLGASYGIILTWGDISKNLSNPLSKYSDVDERNFAYNFYAGIKINSFLTTQIDFTKGQANGSRDVWSDGKPANLRFENNFSQIGVQANFYPQYIVSQKLARTFNPYIATGISFASYRSVKYKSTTNEVLSFYGYKNSNLELDNSITEFAFPIGIGVDLALSKNLYLRFQSIFSFLSTDRFDAHIGIGSNKNDIYSFTSVSFKYTLRNINKSRSSNEEN